MAMDTNKVILKCLRKQIEKKVYRTLWLPFNLKKQQQQQQQKKTLLHFKHDVL